MTNRSGLSEAASIYQVRFGQSVDLGAAEDVLLLAILAVACLHGDSAVRLDARYALDPETRSVVIDGSTTIGQYVLRVFAGLCARQFGEGEFEILRPRAVSLPSGRSARDHRVRGRGKPRKRQPLASGAD